MRTAAFAAVYLIWGSTFLAIHYAIESYPPFLMLGVRFGLAGALMYGVLRYRGHVKPSRSHMRSSIWMGVLLLFVGTGSIAWAEAYIPTGLAAMLIATVPMWVVLLEWLWLKGPKPAPRILFALGTGLVGVAVVVQPPAQVAGDISYFVAIGVSLLAAFSWSFGSLLGRKMELPESPFMGAALQMMAGGVVLSLFGIITGELSRISLSSITLTSSMAVLYLLLFGSLVAFSAYVWLMHHVSASRLSTHAFVNPIVAVLMGTLVAGEALTIRIGISGVLLVTAVVVIVGAGTHSPARIRSRLKRRFAIHRSDVLMAASLSDSHPPVPRNRHLHPQPGRKHSD